MAVEERDEHTGYLTTGHEWNGIKELNRPVPTVIWLFLTTAFLAALACWILLPAWPLGNTYTHGLLRADQRQRVTEEIAEAASKRSAAVAQIESMTFDDIRSDPDLMRNVIETGRTLFGDNCAACHGSTGHGGPGFPNLADNAWLWGGDADAVAETIRIGINSDHPETRTSQMLAFGHDGLLDREAILNVIAYVRSLSNPASAKDHAEAVSAGAKVFASSCAACHGKDGGGNTAMGAPNLTDKFWIYGGDEESIFTTLTYGRKGHMPQWESRLTRVQRKILALYVVNLSSGKEK
ncbi:MAG: cytochrome-c oxidase, cbb3-type subunit III [Methyloceanibacter sp.]|uniref:cytochrome-c oxidase, cbb3-type subunit III n=1 Tax=Methyloceanibacter sp. TaxID=1965321 RepID=UPI001DA6FA03|nr:cytochrome-c oxidase, cbb3-type subunit III [Methyloceanibacter sp.]MCB1441647.1 cytochrome-c oxidase, cbb3-type subunit III [Methyloceanibacter sp.]